MLTVKELAGLLRPTTLAHIIAELRDENMLASPQNHYRILDTIACCEHELGYRVDADEAEALVATARFPPVRALTPEECP